MKKLHILTLSVLIVLVTSCFKDQNNYFYNPMEKITVTGLTTSYDRIAMVDSLVLNPTVTSTDPAAKLTYFWGIYEPNVTGVIPHMDTLSKTTSLRMFVTRASKTWGLVFGVKNTNTGYQTLTTINLNIITQFTRGWYVLKDDGAQTDLDLFLTPATFAPTTKMENVFALVNGKKLNGTAKMMNFDANYYTTVTGTNVKSRVFYVTSTNDASIINPNTMLEIHDFNGSFFTPPANKAPNFFMLGTAAEYFVNDGHIHSISTGVQNYGLFNNYQMRDANNSPYRISDYYLGYYNMAPIFFDETSSSFVSAGATTTVLTACVDATGTAMKANNNNKTLLYMGLKTTTAPVTGIAVLKDKTNPAIRILSTITPTVTAFKMVNDTLLATSKCYNGTLFTVNYTDENMIYFVVGGNQVWSRNLTNKVEQLQYTVPAGETITYLRHRKYSNEVPYTFNFIMVGSKIGSTYNVRMFNKTAGNLAATPSVTLTGTGSVADVFYLAPLVTYYTFNNSY